MKKQFLLRSRLRLGVALVAVVGFSGCGWFETPKVVDSDKNVSELCDRLAEFVQSRITSQGGQEKHPWSADSSGRIGYVANCLYSSGEGRGTLLSVNASIAKQLESEFSNYKTLRSHPGVWVELSSSDANYVTYSDGWRVQLKQLLGAGEKRMPRPDDAQQAAVADFITDTAHFMTGD